jgi:hypothetical protein
MLAAFSVAALGTTSGALAQGLPKGWVQMSTLAFDQALPGDWKELERRRFNPREPWFGLWRYMSPHAHTKLFVRVNTYRPMTMAQLLARHAGYLGRKVARLQPLGRQVTPPDARGRDSAVVYYRGEVPAVNRKTREVQAFEHLIVRVIQRFRDWGVQVSLTYYFAGDRAAEAERFVATHAATFNLNDPKAVRQAVLTEVQKQLGQKPLGQKPGPR